jgi:hypothetical protein
MYYFHYNLISLFHMYHCACASVWKCGGDGVGKVLIFVENLQINVRMKRVGAVFFVTDISGNLRFSLDM